MPRWNAVQELLLKKPLAVPVYSEGAWGLFHMRKLNALVIVNGKLTSVELLLICGKYWTVSFTLGQKHCVNVTVPSSS